MDFMLKQRLVGAIVLVALGVIFIPMLLEGPDRDLVPEMDAMPESGEQELSAPLSAFPPPGVVPLEPEESIVQGTPAAGPAGAEEAEAPVKETAPVPAAEPVPARKARAQAQRGTGDSPLAETARALSGKPAVETAPAPVPANNSRVPGSWVVQAGSFSSQNNALALRDRLRKAGFATQVEKVRIKGKLHYRVRVGPFLERSEAEQARGKLAAGLSPNARVLSYP